MNLNLLKLRKAILQLQEIETDKALLIVESELVEGVEVFVEKEGEFVPAEDGEYVSEDKVLVVAEGRVAEIRDKESQQPEQEQEPEQTEQVQQAEDEQQPEQNDEKDVRIAELEAKLTEQEALLAEKDARIAELEAELAQKQEQLEMSADKPAKDKIKTEVKSGALKYFN